jgi:hypothetical protein
MPKPRDVAPAEKDELRRNISDRFNQSIPDNALYRAAGPFRFLDSGQFLYIDRTDLGSVAFEMSQYGISQTALDPAANTREMLLPRLEAALGRTRLAAQGRQFEALNDEFVGAVQPKEVQADFDPRQASMMVARTATFVRTVDGVPVFGSELSIGIMPDGTIGRFRLHWPKIEDSIVKEARDLQNALRDRKWSQPQSIRTDDISILETTAGIGHSGFADPGFRTGAVVRILYRKSSKDQQYPLSSTGYKYFDANGREVFFNAFPQVAGTRAENKPQPSR